MELDSFLVKKYNVKDLKCAGFLIEAGLLKVDKQIITDTKFPVDETTNLQILDETMLKASQDYWRFREIQKRALLEKSKDALGIGLKEDEVRFLNDSGINTVLLIHNSDKRAKINGLKIIKGNLLDPEEISQLNTKFDYLIANIPMNYFQLFVVLEKYLNYLLVNGKLLAKIRGATSDKSDLMNMIEEFAKNMDLEVEEYITPHHFKDDFWVLFNKVR